MNYLEAKIELTQEAPKISLNAIAAEVATLTAIAAMLVFFFA